MTTTNKVIMTCVILSTITFVIDIAVLSKPLFCKMVVGTKNECGEI